MSISWSDGLSRSLCSLGCMALCGVGASWLARRFMGPPPNKGCPWDETKWSEITKKVRALEKEMGVETSVEIQEQENTFRTNADAFTGRVTLLMDPQRFSKCSPEEQNFVIAHELSHIKHRTALRISTCISLAAFVIPSVVFPILVPGAFLPFHLAAGLVSGWFGYCTAHSVGTNLVEKLADYEAYSICEEKGGISFLTRLVPFERNRLIAFLCGGLDQPALQTRIASLQKWSQERKDLLTGL